MVPGDGHKGETSPLTSKMMRPVSALQCYCTERPIIELLEGPFACDSTSPVNVSPRPALGLLSPVPTPQLTTLGPGPLQAVDVSSSLQMWELSGQEVGSPHEGFQTGVSHEPLEHLPRAS